MFHICQDGHTARPWWPTEQRWDCDPNEVVFTDCCYRRLPASETICRLRSQEYPVGGYGNYQFFWPWGNCEVADWLDFASYYDPDWSVECNPEGDRSCKQHKRFLRGLHLREPL